MRTNVFGLVSVMFAVSVTSLVGCGGATTDEGVAVQHETLTTTYDKLTVVAEMNETGVVTATSVDPKTIGIVVPEPICIMQPMLPAAIACGDFASSVCTLRRFNSPLISGCKRL